MKHFFSLTLIALVVASSFITDCVAKDARKSPHETVKYGNISVTYGRPYKNGRQIFGNLVPYGQVWRTGADEATEVTFKKDCLVNGNPMKAGTYTMFTIPDGQLWKVMFNSKLKQWGAFSYDETKNVLVTQAQVAPTLAPVEQFTITLGEDGITMQWDNQKVNVPVN
ncbi:MAG: DUF2911 domain-containing protein [Chitinophagia bacterium]|nr:DUF2911 domain-containing protein [Chitinophagia bacterium]